MIETEALTLKVPSACNTNLFFYKDIDSDSCSAFAHDISLLNIELSQLEEENSRIINKVCKTNNKLRCTPSTINVHLHTSGGECYSGFTMIHTIEHVFNTRPINIIVDGLCASMGVAILLSVPIEHRFAYKNSTFMIHQVASIALGKVTDLKESVDEAERVNSRIWEMILAKTNITKERMDECYNNRQDWFISAEEALELGIISKII